MLATTSTTGSGNDATAATAAAGPGRLVAMVLMIRAVIAAWVTEVYLQYVFMRMGMNWMWMWMKFQIPSVKKSMIEKMEKANQMEETKLSLDQWQDTIATWAAWRSACKAVALDYKKTMTKGGEAFNAKVFNLEGKPCHMLDYQIQSRPLVVFFGSCSWPPFMAKMEHFKKVASTFASFADFLVVYIEEAHPSDGWSFKDNFDIASHQSIEDRISAAQVLRDTKTPVPIVVDHIDDNANKAYGGLFERLYVLQEGKVEYQGGRGPQNCHVPEVEEWLKVYTNNNV